MLTIGSEDGYEWLVTDQQFDLLDLCPAVALGKYVAITSIDSGEFVPGEKYRAAGWRSQGKIAYSSKIVSAEDVPRDGWDEWYIFGSPTALGASRLAENVFETPHKAGHVDVFVNYGFAPHLPGMKGLAALFWQQIDRIRPESYVADNDYLTFAAVDTDLFASVRNALTALPGGEP